VAQLNRHNRIQLVIGDPATAALRIGGRIRADNEAGFLRLLDSSFGVKAQAQGDDELVLSKSK
jgi:transmembrane sensor